MYKFDTLLRWIDHSTGFQDNQDVVLFRPEFFVAKVLEDTIVK